MALSQAILARVQRNIDEKKNGGSAAASSSPAQSNLSIEDRVALNVALKRAGFTRNRENGLLNDSRYSNYQDIASSVNDDYINEFINDWDAHSVRMQTAYDGLNWRTAASKATDSLNSAGNDLLFRSAMIRYYLEKNKDQYEENWYNSFLSGLDSVQKYQRGMNKTFSDARKFYSQWETEDDYNAWVEWGKNAEAGLRRYQDDQKAGNQGEETFWEKIGRYLGVSADTTLPNAGMSQVSDSYRRDTTYREPTADWNDEQKKTFGYFYAQDPEKAFKFAEQLNSNINAAKKAEQAQKVTDDATSGIGKGFLHSAGAVLGNATGLADYLNDAAEYAARGRITEKTGELTPFEYSQAVTGGISQHLNEKYGTLNEKIPVVGGKGLGDLYGLGMSVAQSAQAAYTLGPVGTLVQFFGSAAASGVDDAKSRGASDEQALWFGALSGVAEGAAEMVGVDNLLKIGASSTMREVMINVAKQGIAEGAEEGITSVLNNFADQLVMGDKSNFHILVQDYMNKGWSEDEARTQAWKDMAEDVAYDMLGGFVSGAVHAGPQTAYESVLQNRAYQNAYGGNAAELVQEGLQSKAGSLSHELAVKYQEKMVKGGTLTGAEINRLVKANEQSILAEDVDNIRNDAAELLATLGEQENVMALADVIAKKVTKQKVTRQEQAILDGSSFGTWILDELSMGTARAENIRPVTDRITDNAQDYQARSEMQKQGGFAAPERTQQNQPAKREMEAPQREIIAPVTQQTAPEPKATVRENRTVPESVPIQEAKKEVSLTEAAQKYGDQAKAMEHTYIQGQDVEKYDQAYGIAYEMGRSGVSLTYAKESEGTAYLTDDQKELAFEAGQAAARQTALSRQNQNQMRANGKTGRKIGAIRGQGVTVEDLRASLNDTQGKAYKYLSTVAEVTGVDIVLFKSQPDSEGRFTDDQGAFKWNEDTIYIDLNAGLSNVKDVEEAAKYTMLRTYSHEFTHFIEKWEPVQYNELREVVFSALTEKGENVHDLIEEKMALDSDRKMTYEQASREVIAEAMTDILPDAAFVQQLAEKHKTVFQRILDKLKEFVSNVREYFNSVGSNRSREANALKHEMHGTVRYVQSIVDLFDKAAVQAVETYQQAVATDVVVSENATAASETVVETKVEENVEPAATESEQSDFAKAFWNATQAERDEVVDAINENTKISHVMPTEIREGNDVNSDLEVSDNGKEEQNADTQGTVLEPEPDREGASRLLDELQTGDVPGDGSVRDAVGDSGERGQKAGRDGDRPDAQRSGGGSSEGSGQGRDLRHDGGRNGRDRGDGTGSAQPGAVRPVRGDSAYGGRGLNAEDVTDNNVGNKTAKYTNVHSKEAEKLREEVVERIQQQSTEQPKGRNFVIGDSLDLPNGEKARYKANVEAIRLVKKLEAEGRYATEAEQVILSKYVGWGGLANAFDQRKTDWAKEYAELKELLTEEEYASARGSTLNAHYTDVSVIKAMYDGLKQLGFNGGRMMEPSSGVGNFVGAMPTDMAAKVRSWTMVELDGITGLIAKYLYPNADVRIQGFEKANIPNNFMDVAISNVPFGNYSIADKSYPKKITSAIHNYFFAKSLDKVRPGGIVMFITSSYTMNSSDSTVRRYIMQKADLLGAIRLPDTAFKGNAGTEVVTDILVLKKRAENTNYAGEDFLEAPYTRPVTGSWSGAYINDYFNNHPEMVLGTASFTGGMYRGDSLTYKALENKGSLADQIRKAFENIQGKMDYPSKLSPEKTNFAVERADKKTKENGLVVKDGKVYKNTGGELVEQKVTKGVVERISGMLEIRDAAKVLQNAQQQGLKDSEIKKARQKLNKAYDDFVKKHGFINSQANKNAIADDPDRYSILALENWNPETKKATKADIFTKNTIAPNRVVTSAKDVAEGLIVSVNQTGGVDAALIAKLTGKTEAEVTRELLDSRQVFKNRDGGLETAEVYLSGNVRAKLRDAEALVSLDADYQKNVEALKAVMPEDVGYEDIFVNPGTPWIPDSVYSDFAAYMLGTVNREWRKAVEVTRNADTGNFTVELKEKYLKSNSYNTQKWGTNRRSFLDLFDAMLNSKSVVVKYKTDDGKSVVDQDATAAANEKVENIKKEFQEWLWKDENRRSELAILYNETFNSIVTPKYNGDNLTVNGANAMKPLRPHQRNAVQRIIASGGNTLLAHKVGAGKTYEMAAAAMKLKELGLVKKPMFAVPKSLVAQWGNEFMDFFPTAKLLVAEASDFTAANRKVFMNRIANGEYDAVIVSYEQFERLPVSDEFKRDLYQEQIESVIRAIEEAKADKGGKSLSVKDLEKKRKQLQTKIDKLSDSAKDEDNIDFEQLGVDSIFVDEAHNFKNLFYTTSMTNVSGLGNKDGSKRAFDLYTKVRYLQKLNGGRGIVFATATPVMNSMSEMYIMQKYLQPDLLDQLGLSTFDAWAKQFGEVVNGVEIKPSGQGYRVKQSFSRFKNMSELQLLFRNFADVLTDIPGLKIPKMKGGKVNVVVCEPGQFQQDYMKELEKRADNIKNVDPAVDNMLKITSDGRKISYTQRMIDPSLPYEEGCKIYRCADNVLAKYQESKEIKGTQIIFCDMATPKGKSSAATTETEEIETDMESAKLYDDIKSRLVKGGIPAKEIAFIHEADTDAKKKKLFADVNEGKVRVLIGSTGKMGVGMNAQKRIVAIHHLDAPWRPGDVEQRNGRAFRQGNINDEVENFTYVTEGSFDARLWDILERKQNFINQVMNGENVGRETEDTGEVTLSAAEVKALASGSPLIMEQVQLDTDIKKLESLQRAHRSAVTSARSRLETDKGNIETYQKFAENGKKDLAARVDTYSDGKFSITLGKRKFTDKKEAGAELMAVATAKATEEGYTTIGKFAGFDLRVIKTYEGIKGLISGSQGYSFNTYPGNTTYMISHLIGKVEGIEEAVKLWEHKVSEAKRDMAEQEKLINQPFARQAELDQKRTRYNEVMEILNPKEEQQLSSMEESVEQHQPRTKTLTDREVLALAANDLSEQELTQAQRDALSIFRKRLSRLETLQTEREELGRKYKELQFGAHVDREEAARTLEKMRDMDGQIREAERNVLAVEDKDVLHQVLKKARKVVEQQERKHGEEILKRWRDRRNNAAVIRKYREQLKTDVDELTQWILKPSNKDSLKHIPEVVKGSVIPFLSSIDFTSDRALRGGNATKEDQRFLDRLNALHAALKPQQDAEGLYSDYSDLPPNFLDKLNDFIKTVSELTRQSSNELVVNRMTAEEVKTLRDLVRTLKTFIKNFNRFHANAIFHHVHEAGDSTISTLSEMSDAGKSSGQISNFVFWQQIRPAYAFERFGEGGKAIYDGLRRGQAQLAFDTKQIQEFAEKAYTSKEVSAWEKEMKTIQLEDGEVQIPVSGIMSFYELSKRPQALGHILGQGIRVAKRKGAKGDPGHRLTVEDVNAIISLLTPRQKEVADMLQKYMQEQGGKWGNHVSMARFGEQLFGEENYFPINSDGRYLPANAEEKPGAASLYALLNMGFTKQTTEGANNRIMLYSIFDVFANHMASMAQYHALALPVVDALKWFNYQQKSEPDMDGRREVLSSVRDQMDRVYGLPEEKRPGSGRQGYAQSFVIDILKAFNGTEAQGIPEDTAAINALHRYNIAQVAFNGRVIAQQPMAITRAAQLISPVSLTAGLAVNMATVRNNIQEMRKYSGIAAWKSLGFYDVNISRGLTKVIKHDASAIEKIGDAGMAGAEAADTFTWAAIWCACKEEVIHKRHILPKNAGFYEEVTKLFEEVIYKTQVVDSVLTKNKYLRSKGGIARSLGSFMSEPTTTASMLVDMVDKYNLDRKRGMTLTQAAKKNGKNIIRTICVYSAGAIFLSAVQAVYDAWRDDDEYEDFWEEKWQEAFWDNLLDELMPFNKLPILSQVYEIVKGIAAAGGMDIYGQMQNFVWADIAEQLIKSVEIASDLRGGENTSYTWYGAAYKLLQAASGMTGLPMAAATREVVDIWNHFAPPDKKLKTYDAGETANIRYAYADGYLTEEEAMQALLESGSVESEEEAYWKIQEWGNAEGSFSRYDKLYDAVRNGQDITDAMDELTAYGHQEKAVLSNLKEQIGKWYKGKEIPENEKISKQQAIEMLRKYFDMDSDEITRLVNKWSCYVVTGVEYDDIHQEFLDGNIKAGKAAEWLVRYGGKSTEDAEDTVRKWKCEADTGVAYDDARQVFLDQGLTEKELKDIYTTYGGYTDEEAQEKVDVLAFIRKHPTCTDISWKAIQSYKEYCEGVGVKAETFYEVWKFSNATENDVDENGRTIAYSAVKKIMAKINGMSLTAEQKTAVAEAMGWKESTIRKYKLW